MVTWSFIDMEMEENMSKSEAKRKEPIKYPPKGLPQRKYCKVKTPQLKPEMKARQEVEKRKSGDPESRAKPEESQKNDDKEGNDVTATDKKASDATIQEMFPEVVPATECELDALTSRVLEYELRHIMIKVWQEFPDDPPTDGEKLVAEKFRNEAGDDIRNVIGLNVTKRLLNVHNRLIVKVRFSSRPEKSYLLSFLKKYKIRGFKRVASETNTFAAQLKTIDDFDRICAEKFITCGNAKLTITPCYTFMKCPPKLKTKFVDETDDENTETKDNESKEKSDVKNNKEESRKTEITVTENKEKVKAEEEQKKNDSKVETENATKDIEQERVKQDKEEAKSKPNVDSSKTTKKSDDDTLKKENIQTNDRGTVQKSEDSLNKVSNKTTKEINSNVGKSNGNEINKTDATVKPVTVQKSEEKSTIVTKKTQNATNQPTANKSETIKTPVIANNTTAKSVPKPKTLQKTKAVIANQNTNKIVTKNLKIQPQRVQSASKIEPKSKVSNIKIVQKVIKKDVIEKYDDYEEMADEDILALLSEGVVLDECGSDDE